MALDRKKNPAAYPKQYLLRYFDSWSVIPLSINRPAEEKKNTHNQYEIQRGAGKKCSEIWDCIEHV